MTNFAPSSQPQRELHTALRSFGNDLLEVALGLAPQHTTVAKDSPLITALSLLGVSLELSAYKAQSQTSPFEPLEAGRALRQSDITKLKDEEQRKRLLNEWPKLPTEEGQEEFPPAAQPAALGLFGAAVVSDPASHYQNFDREQQRLADTFVGFESYCQLYRKYATYVAAPQPLPASLPLYELFHSLAALTLAGVTPDGTLLLAGGDLPGIQNMLYTIGSGGAAKALRGRSFYLGLLGDMAVRVILHRFALPTASLMYNAGGNFLAVLPNDEPAFAAVCRELNEKLLRLHHGELYFAFASAALPLAGDFASSFTTARNELGTRLAQAKLGYFAEQDAARLYDEMFRPRGSGGYAVLPDAGSDADPVRTVCPVCQVDFKAAEVALSREQYEQHQKNDDYEYKPRCHQCASFETIRDEQNREISLAYKLRNANYLRVSYLAEGAGRRWDAEQYSKPSWDEVAAEFGLEYAFTVNPPQSNRQREADSYDFIYKLNEPDGFIASTSPNIAYGFRYLANQTPRDEDGTIRDTRGMARVSRGVPRYGVLRMDVDGLGRIFGRDNRMDMPTLTAISNALSLYFEGWLNRITLDVADAAAMQARSSPAAAADLLPYIIYAGGDDLLVVSTWDLLADFADRVRRDLAAYAVRGYLDQGTEAAGREFASPTQEKGEPAPAAQLPLLTISGGLSVVDAKFPLYQAAEEAKHALEDEAKQLPRRAGGLNSTKYGFCLLGQAIGWEEYGAVAEMRDWIVNKVQREEGAAPEREARREARSLLRRLNAVNALYRQTEAMQARRLSDQPPPDLLAEVERYTFYSRWQWRLLYSLRAMDGQWIYDRAVSNTQRNAIGQLGLATRWAELLTRQQGKDGAR